MQARARPANSNVRAALPSSESAAVCPPGGRPEVSEDLLARPPRDATGKPAGFVLLSGAKPRDGRTAKFMIIPAGPYRLSSEESPRSLLHVRHRGRTHKVRSRTPRRDIVPACHVPRFPSGRDLLNMGWLSILRQRRGWWWRPQGAPKFETGPQGLPDASVGGIGHTAGRPTQEPAVSLRRSGD